MNTRGKMVIAVAREMSASRGKSLRNVTTSKTIVGN